MQKFIKIHEIASENQNQMCVIRKKLNKNTKLILIPIVFTAWRVWFIRGVDGVSGVSGESGVGVLLVCSVSELWIGVGV